MTNTLLGETLAIIAAERPDKFDRSFSLAKSLLAECGEHDLANRLDAEISAEIAPEVVADLLNILSWIVKDNGSEIVRTAERWLRECSDLRRIQIALNLEVYPFLDRAEMEQVLLGVALGHPDVATRCHELIASRRCEGSKRPTMHSGKLRRTGELGQQVVSASRLVGFLVSRAIGL